MKFNNLIKRLRNWKKFGFEIFRYDYCFNVSHTAASSFAYLGTKEEWLPDRTFQKEVLDKLKSKYALRAVHVIKPPYFINFYILVDNKSDFMLLAMTSSEFTKGDFQSVEHISFI